MAEKLIRISREERTGTMGGSIMLLDTHEVMPITAADAREIAHTLRPIDPQLRNGGLIHLSQPEGKGLPSGAIIYKDNARPLPESQAQQLSGIAERVGSRRQAGRPKNIL